jgi:hypothetical protein
MSYIRHLAWLLSGSLGIATGASAQTTIFHDPFLNWDFINFTGQEVNDFEIVVASPNYVPPAVYTGGLGFPNFSRSVGDYSPAPGLETLLRWSGRNFAPGAVAHVGAAMMGSGRILDAYWTRDGQKVGPSIGITYELTRVTRTSPTAPAVLDMVLNTSPAFALDNPNASLLISNIRTFRDIPADLLGLDDITAELDLGRLSNFEIPPNPSQGELVPDRWLEVSLGTTLNANANFEALLVADIVLVPPSLPPVVIGRFWNINPQSPEPALLGTLVASLVVLNRRR